MAQVTDITNTVNYTTIVRCETGVNAKNHADIPLSAVFGVFCIHNPMRIQKHTFFSLKSISY